MLEGLATSMDNTGTVGSSSTTGTSWTTVGICAGGAAALGGLGYLAYRWLYPTTEAAVAAPVVAAPVVPYHPTPSDQQIMLALGEMQKFMVSSARTNSEILLALIKAQQAPVVTPVKIVA